MAATGLLLAYRLPLGSRGGRDLLFLGLDRHGWGDIHLWLSFAFLFMAIVHLVLNWKWLQKVAASAGSWQLIAGLGFGLAVIAFFLFVPITRLSTEKDGRPRWGKRGRDVSHSRDVIPK